MTQHNLTQILKVIRDLVMRNRPCYRDYLGTETVTTTTQICHGNENGLDMDDVSFTDFVIGETYQVSINGETENYVARLDNGDSIIGTYQVNSEGEESGWCIYMDSGNLSIYAVDGIPADATISVSQTKTETVKRYNTKLLPEYLLPAFLRKNVVASKAEVQSAAAKATAAATAAANAAATAQTTANAAQTTADTAKNIADAALPKTGGELSGAISVTNGTDTSKLYASLFDMQYFPTGATQMADRVAIDYDAIILGASALSVPGITLRRNKGSSQAALLRLAHSGGTIQIESDGRFYSSKRLVLECQNELEIQAVGAKKGATSLILHSSTTDSTKRFRITVDDTGTLTATEVTS